jgi:hypothetical protein
MSVEQVARDFVATMNDAEKVKGRLTSDAMFSGGVLPQPLPATEALNILAGFVSAMPDIKWDIQQATVDGNKVTVKALWGGTHTGPLTLPMPGMPPIPASGKKVSGVKDTYVITVEGDKVSHIHVDSPADGGIPAALAQIGVSMPPM